MAVLAFRKYNETTPKIVKTMAIAKAMFTDILPEGIGLFFVRFIRASKSLSII